VLVLAENAFVLSVGRLYLMRLGFLVTTGFAQNAAQKWRGHRVKAERCGMGAA